MRFKHVFSIIGPVMVGPSSSHTAGAARIGRVSRQMLGCSPEEAVITLYGSFAETYSGHGTDLAIIGGLLDFDTDDARIPEAFAEAERLGMKYDIRVGTGIMPHPNFAEITVKGGGREATVQGASIGGGNIEIHSINGFDAGCTGNYPTLVIAHHDQVGVVAAITNTVSAAGLNIGFMNVARKARSGDAMTVIEGDRVPSGELVEALRRLTSIENVSIIDVR
ncbi:L-serine ammonia-lyase, iron-sulfur-dependent subunit beta [Paenibacillus glycanilyticus]|uniref:L-serine ammonia-lyase, iron-sulfur-dependent subunit beta n=1 Tax=Paenibacillus glycanilyticus TaxID=126569 RepID=UPI00203DA224|nr:L-serine ammonia-lyase, iron-sulfur-dependent subunit beta [Paenibacillus glycanilyticus]MCM3627670.1 L-serine ammonia-lyase, iron-sulfur-dependent subunit beta [Paenibacillus glycanilyticus]